MCTPAGEEYVIIPSGNWFTQPFEDTEAYHSPTNKSQVAPLPKTDAGDERDQKPGGGEVEMTPSETDNDAVLKVGDDSSERDEKVGDDDLTVLPKEQPGSRIAPPGKPPSEKFVDNAGDHNQKPGGEEMA